MARTVHMRLELTRRSVEKVATHTPVRPVADRVVIRRVRPADGEALSAFYAGLSPDSLHARFLGYTRGIASGLARSFCTLDHMHDEGFVAVVSERGSERIVGHLCLAHLSATQLELGIAVGDEFQGRGMGRRLFETAIAWAREHRFASVVASCFARNSRVLALLTSTPYGAQVTTSDGGVVEVVIPLVGPLPTTRSWPPYGAAHTPRAHRLRGRPSECVGRMSVSRLRVVSRHKPRPGPVAEGSASRGSS